MGALRRRRPSAPAPTFGATAPAAPPASIASAKRRSGSAFHATADFQFMPGGDGGHGPAATVAAVRPRGILIDRRTRADPRRESQQQVLTMAQPPSSSAPPSFVDSRRLRRPWLRSPLHQLEIQAPRPSPPPPPTPSQFQHARAASPRSPRADALMLQQMLPRRLAPVAEPLATITDVHAPLFQRPPRPPGG